MQTVNSHEEEGAELVNTNTPSSGLVINFTRVMFLFFVSHCFALQCSLGGAIVICIQSKYTAGGARLVRGRPFIQGVLS